MSGVLKLGLVVQGDWASTFDRLSAALAELAERVPEVGFSLAGFGNSTARLASLFTVHSDTVAAAGTHELRIRLEPSETFLGLLSASGASEGDLELIHQCFRHSPSPSLFGDSMVARVGEGA